MLSVYLNKYPVFQRGFIDYYVPIKDWNIERGNTEFKLSLEKSMLEEECTEFLVAKTVVDKLDAFLDYTFVLMGTIHKSFVTNLCNEPVLENMIELQEDLFYILYAEFSNKNKDITDSDFVEILYQGMQFVIEANNNKGKVKNEQGKITKPVDFVGPEVKLTELLNQFGISELGE